jgi:type VI secretion system protein ImpL
MKWLFKLIKQVRFWLILLFVLLTIILVILGYLMDWSTEVLILSIVILFFILVFIYMFLNLRAARNTRKIEQSLTASDVSYLAPDRKEEIEKFRKKMSLAIQSLKKPKLSIRGKEKSNLYSLPWYIFVGLQNSGKTTLINQSGLNFSAGSESGVAQNCDILTTNTSVLIDVAGNIFEEDDKCMAQGEWYALLELLQKHRRPTCLNGIILNINIMDLLNAGKDEQISFAKNLRNRVDELIKYSGLHLPVYFVFTKCDMLEGFEEFFSELKDKELGQIWGYTYDKKPGSAENLTEKFERELHNLYKVLNLYRLNSLSFSRNFKNQAKIYNFPEKFYSIFDSLRQFFGTIIQENFYKEIPLFRGFYFTSATQMQLTTSHASQEVEMQFNPETHITKQRESVVNPRSYFTKELFSRLIIPDKYLAKPTSTMKFQANFRNLVFAVIATVIMLSFVISVIINASRNIEDIVAFKNIIKSVKQVEWNQKNLKPLHFRILNQIRLFNDHVQDAPFLGGSIYQGERLVEPINRLYVNKFTPFFLEYLYLDILSNYLQKYVSRSPDISRDRAYEYLRAYLLLDSNVEKLIEVEAEKGFLKNLMISLVDTLFEQKYNLAFQSSFNEQNISNLKTLIQNEVEFYIEALSMEGMETVNNEKRLIEQVRRILGKPDILDIYSRIKREGMVKFKKVSISQIIPEHAGEFFEADASISGFYTKNAWETYVKEEIDISSRNPDRDDWVLNIAASQLPAEFHNAKLMEQKLKDRYFYDYSRAWWNFLGRIRYITFRNAKNASEQLTLLGDFIDSPLRKILDIVAFQTKFEGLIVQKAQELKKELGLNSRKHSIDDQFRIVHSLSEDEGGKLANLLGQYENISGFMETLGDPDENSAGYASEIIQKGSGEIPSVLQSIRRSLRRLDQNARESVFEKPILMSWQVLLEKTQNYLNQQWTEQVYQPFQTMLANQYPINRRSKEETPPGDIAQFFKKNDGTIWSFITNELEPFLKTKSWNPEMWEGSGINLSETYKVSLQKASKITEGLGLINNDELQLDFRILPQLPISKIGNVEQIKLSIDGQELVYRMGRPAWENFIWPNTENISNARLEVRTRISTYRPQQFDGSWGWFRLLDQAIIQKSTASEFNVQWRFPPDQNYEIQVKFKIRANSINNPFGQKNFFNISFPSSLAQ